MGHQSSMVKKKPPGISSVNTVAVCLLLTLAVSSMALAGAAATGFMTTQTADSGTVAPGDNVELNVTLENIPSDATSAGIDLELPDGWTIVSPADGGLGNCTSACSPDASFRPNETQFLLFMNGSSSPSFTVNYTVSVPSSASDGSYSIVANGNYYNSTQNATVWHNTTTTVNVSSGPPALSDSSDPPTDPDNDGAYEDINGDGTFDVIDVSTLFDNRESSVIGDYVSAFDFNDDGDFNVIDVSTLFDEL